MNQPPLPPPLEQTVVIVGVGLIGGSLAAAIKSRQIAKRVIGIGRDPKRIDAARVAGLIDETSIDVNSVVDHADLVIFCTPVDQVAGAVQSLVTKSATKLRPTLLITDAGSVKGPICEQLRDVPQFIGSHPIAGSHRQGFEAADPQLFAGRVCVLTPHASAAEAQVQRLERFWQAVGMQTLRMTPAEHDQALATTSHVPHVVAAALAATLSDEQRQLTGSGFRDTTRVAAGDPGLWAGILMNNAAHVITGIDAVQQQLARYRAALVSHNAAEIQQLLADGQNIRASLNGAASELWRKE